MLCVFCYLDAASSFSRLEPFSDVTLRLRRRSRQIFAYVSTAISLWWAGSIRISWHFRSLMLIFTFSDHKEEDRTGRSQSRTSSQNKRDPEATQWPRRNRRISCPLFGATCTGRCSTTALISLTTTINLSFIIWYLFSRNCSFSRIVTLLIAGLV